MDAKSNAAVICYVASNGDVGFDCGDCNETMFVPIEMSDSTFWDIYIGRALLRMLAHIKEEHESVIKCRYHWSTTDKVKLFLRPWRTEQVKSFHWCMQNKDHLGKHVCAICRVMSDE